MDNKSIANICLELHPLEFSLNDFSKLTSLELALVWLHPQTETKLTRSARITFLKRRTLELEDDRESSIVSPTFSLLVKTLLLLENRDSNLFPTPGKVRAEMDLRFDDIEYYNSNIIRSGYRNLLRLAEGEGIIRQGRDDMNREWIRLESKYRKNYQNNKTIATGENFHTRSLKFSLDLNNLSNLSSEEILLSQFKVDFTTEIGDLLEEIWWKRRAEAAEKGFHWKVESNTPPPISNHSNQTYSHNDNDHDQNLLITLKEPSSIDLSTSPLTPLSNVPLFIINTVFQLYLQFSGDQTFLPNLLLNIQSQQSFFKSLNAIGWTYYHTSDKSRFYIAFESLGERNEALNNCFRTFIPGSSGYRRDEIKIEVCGTEELWVFDDFEESFLKKWGVVEENVSVEKRILVEVEEEYQGKKRNRDECESITNEEEEESKLESISSKRNKVDLEEIKTKQISINERSEEVGNGEMGEDKSEIIEVEESNTVSDSNSTATSSVFDDPTSPSNSTIQDQPSSTHLYQNQNTSPPDFVSLLLSRLPGSDLNPSNEFKEVENKPSIRNDNDLEEVKQQNDIKYSPIPEENKSVDYYRRFDEIFMDDTPSPEAESFQEVIIIDDGEDENFLSCKEKVSEVVSSKEEIQSEAGM